MGKYEALAIASTLPDSTVKEFVAGDAEAIRNGRYIHDLLRAVLNAFDVVHERTAVDLVHQGTFYAFGFFRRGKTVKRIDARPSDAIALALRMGAEMCVHPDVVEQAGGSRDRLEAQVEAWREKERLSSIERRRKKLEERKAEAPCFLTSGRSVRFTIKSRRKFVWKSSNPSIASVNAEGIVEGLKEGKASITATWKGKSKRQ